MGRLDRLYVNQGMVNLAKRTCISPSGFSDHHMVVMVCALPFHSCRSAYWTFNVKLLQDVHFKDAFRLVWGKLEMEKHSYLNIRQWCDCTNFQIRVFCQQYCLYTTSYASGLISVLKSEILDHEQKAGTSAKNDQQLTEKKTLLAELVKERAAGALVHLRMSKIRLDIPNKDFFNLEKATKTSQQIHSLRSPEGVLLTRQSDIKNSLQNFYSKLFSRRMIDKTVANGMIDFLPSLSEEQRHYLDGDISLEELSVALKQIEDGKAPGLDGLPVELYKAFWDILGPTQHEILLESLDHGELPLSCRRAVLCLLPKKGDAANYKLAACIIAQYGL